MRISFYLLLILIITILIQPSTSFTLNIHLFISQPIKQITISNQFGIPISQQSLNLSTLNLEFLNIDYSYTITLTSNAPSLSFCGYVQLDEYVYYTSNNQIWYYNNKSQSSILPSLQCSIYGEVTVNSNMITLKIPNNITNIQSKSNEQQLPYTCINKEYMFLLGSVNNINIPSLITTLSPSDNIKLIIPNSLKGSLTQDNITTLPTGSNITIEQTLISYTTYISSNTTPVETYTESIRYYAYANEGKIYPQLCTEKTITLVICGTGCKSCGWNEDVGEYLCNECQDDFYFLDNNMKYCVSILSKPINYYIKDSKYLLPCYEKCATCETYEIDDNNQKCKTCKDEFKYALYNENDDTYNCYNNCTDEGAYQQEDDYICLKECKDTLTPYNYNNIKCVSQCPFYVIEPLKKCVDTCAGEAIYKYISSDGTECVDDEHKSNNNYQHISVDPTNDHQNIISITKRNLNECPDNLPYKNKDSNYCRSSCDEPNAEYLDYEQRLCINKCDPSIHYEVTEIKHCYTSSCPNTYPFKINYDSYKHCVKKCNTYPYIYTDYFHKECLISCNDSQLNAHYEYGNQCLTVCPLFTKNKNKKCLLDLSVVKETNDYIITKMQKEEILQQIDANIIELINFNKTIKGNDFLLQIYTSSLPIISNNETSSILFHKCERILKRAYDIDINNDIIIAKFDYIDNNAITNQIQYKAFDYNGNELNLQLCNNVTVNIMYSINSPKDVKLDEAYMFYKEGIDIYNIKDSFYNDICFPYSLNGYDLSPSERIKNYYMDISFCESNCEYLYTNYTHNKVVCKCKVKDVFEMGSVKDDNRSNNNINERLNRNEYKDKVNIMKCYKLFSKWKYLKDDLSLWFFGIINVINAISLYGNVTYELKQLYTSLNKFCKGNPPKQVKTQQPQEIHIVIDNFLNENNNNNHNHLIVETGVGNDYFSNSRTNPNNNSNSINIISNENSNISNREDNIDFSNERMVKDFKQLTLQCEIKDDYSWLSHSKTQTENIKQPLHKSTEKALNKKINVNHYHCSSSKKVEIDLVNFIPLITTSNINNLPYFMAHQLDKRSFCSIYFSLLKQRHLFLHACFRTSPFDIPSLNLMLFLLYIILLFTFNAFFYKKNIFDVNKEDEFYLKGFDIANACSYAFVSFVICFIIITIIRKLLSFDSKYNVIVKEMGVDEYMQSQMIRKLLKRFKVMFIMYLIVDVCAYLLLWYYLILFNVVLKGNQYKWFICGCLSVGFSFVVSAVVCFILGVMKFIGIKNNVRGLYNVSLFLQEIYLV